MKERPILFSAPMVRAILDGRKTVTRRPVKVQPRSPADIGIYGKGQPFIRNPDVTKLNPECPFGKPGDRLWVRESGIYSKLLCPEDPTQPGTFRHDVPRTPELGDWWIQSTRAPGASYSVSGNPRRVDKARGQKAVPSIHMPRWACRILLEITDVRVERLQDISRADIRAEGLQCPPELASDDVSPNYRDWYPAAWKELWNSTGGDWDANPWVWVVEFKRVTP